ncbi:MAG: sensor histidine kinase [Candidatus Bruticola sp.]
MDNVVWNEGARSLSTIVYYFSDDQREAFKAKVDEQDKQLKRVRGEHEFWRSLRHSFEDESDIQDRKRVINKPKFRMLSMANFNGDYQKMAEVIGRNCRYVRIYNENKEMVCAYSRDEQLSGNNMPRRPSDDMFNFLADNWLDFKEHERIMRAPKVDKVRELIDRAHKILKESGFTYYGPPRLPRENGLIHYLFVWLADERNEMARHAHIPPPHFGPFNLVYVDSPNYQIMLCPIIESERLSGYVEAAVPWNYADKTIKLINRIFTVGTLLLAVFISFAGILVGRVLSTPIQKVLAVVNKLNVGDLTARVNLGDGRNEIYIVANALDRMLDTMQGVFLEQQRFIGDASHELKTPLTSLMGAVHVLKLEFEKAEVSDKVRSTMLTVDKELSRMEHLVMDLLILSRNQELSYRTIADPVSINEVVACAVDASLSEALEHPVKVETGRDIWILGDSSALSRAVRNIIDNALRHTPKDKQVKVSTKVGAKEVEILITDEGCGIAPEHLANLGKRFYRVDTGRDRICGGTGLGIPITEAIVKRHKGSVTFTSELGKGTQVSIKLPLTSGIESDA